MQALEIAAAFEQIAPVATGNELDRTRRTNGFRFGNPRIEVTGLAVAWCLALEVIEGAIARGLNVVHVHEPHLFYSNDSPWYSCLLPETYPPNLKNQQLLIEHNLCVYTSHSNWDLQPDVGMQPTFAKALGLSNEIKRDRAVGIYAVEPMTFPDLIEMVRTATGLKHLRVQGDPRKQVNTVAVGFGGMGTVVDTILIHEADAGIFGEVNEFAFLAARESGVGLIEASHLVSESIGFRSVVDVMQAKLPDLRIEFLEVPFAYDWV